MVQARQKRGFSPAILVGLCRVGEYLGLILLGFLAHAWHVAPQYNLQATYVFALLVMPLAYLVVAQSAGAYRLEALRKPLKTGLRVTLAWSGIVLGAMALAFSLRLEGSLSRLWLGLWFGGGLIGLLAGRAVAALATGALTRAGRLDRYTVIVGGGPLAEMLLTELSRQACPDLRILGLFDDREDDRSPDLIAGYPKLGTIDDLIGFARHTRVDQVIFALPITAEGRILAMLRKLWVLPVDIRLAAHANRLRFRPRSYSYIGAVPVFDVLDKPMSDWAVLGKAVFDRIVGAFILVAAAPLMLATALGVKLTSRGPVLFKQERYGFNNERIVVYKFRSLFIDQADPLAHKLVGRDDPRVTPFGRFIRKSSLDELPQLFNVVFKGDLSLVGPRPHALEAKAADWTYEQAVDGYFARHRVKPGVTGWAQVNGWRGETDTVEKIQRRVECDLEYIENWSLALDIYILAATPFALFRGDSAY
jgi:Undecaprenyl-phosphate glucose phosphotransferase